MAVPGVSSRHDNILRKKGTILSHACFLGTSLSVFLFILLADLEYGPFLNQSRSMIIIGTVIIALNYTLEMGREDQLPWSKWIHEEE